MIDARYVQVMARYNAWQNKQLCASFETLSEDALREDRRAFFGSIFATANHILWADRAWLARLGVGEMPEGVHTELTPDLSFWITERRKTDAQILAWSETLDAEILASEVPWHSVMMGQDFRTPYAVCVVHLFNHATHHRGQIHAMLTAAGATAPTTDLPFMPEAVQ